jgi:hypothetical protein
MSLVRLGAGLAVLALAAACSKSSPAAPNPPATGLRLVSASLQLPATAVGQISYASTTIINGETNSEKMTGFGPNTGPFWSTQGGTCNTTYAFVIPAGAQCTLEWGFKPTTTGAQTATGTISFESGKTLSLALSAVGT